MLGDYRESPGKAPEEFFSWFISLVKKFKILFPDCSNPMSEISCRLKAWSADKLYNMRLRWDVLDTFEMNWKMFFLSTEERSGILLLVVKVVQLDG